MAGHTEDPRASDAGVGNLLGGDGFRGIGMSLVFVAHVFANADPAPTLESYGWAKQPIARIDLALATFFVLSGYLIARPFMRSFVLGTKRPSIRRFARNRVLRILPIFYIIAALVLLRFGLDGSIGPTPDNPTGTAPASAWWQILSVFTFTQSYTGGSATLPIGQAWSLDVEAAFYLAIPHRGDHRLPARQAAEDAESARHRGARLHRLPHARSASPCASTPTTASRSSQARRSSSTCSCRASRSR